MPVARANPHRGKQVLRELKTPSIPVLRSVLRRTRKRTGFLAKFRGVELYEAAVDLAETFGINLPILPQTESKLKESKSKISRGHHPPSP